MQFREKARLFHDLAQMVKSGVSFPASVQSLAKHARGESAAVLRAISARLAAGDRVSEAIEAQTGRLDSLETGIIAAADTAGKLEGGLLHCSEYYESLASARSRIRSRLLYPLFILHFAALSTALPRAFGEHGSIEQALGSAAKAIAILWLLIAAVIFVANSLLAAARGSRLFDGALRALPVIGPLRRAFSMSRFCAAYNMQLDAGINVYTSLAAAARASGSAVVSAASERAVEAVRQGQSVADGIGPSGAFPEPVVRAFLVGEKTGSLDHELRRLANEYRDSALQRLESISEWLPRLVLTGVAIYIGYTIVRFYLGYFRSLNDVINGGV